MRHRWRLVINLKNINKSYSQGGNQFHVLHDINLAIDAGEYVSIIGQSGSGKSTVINIIGFLDDQFEREYQFNDTQIQTLKRAELTPFRNASVGFIFQNFKLIRTMSVSDNIALPLLYAGEKRRQVQARIDEQLTRVGLPDVGDKLPTALSGGQQQRVSIARALVANPSFLIADEPTGALDSRTSAEIMQLFKELNDQGTTIILVTHDPNVAAATKRTVEILDGRIIADSEVSS